MEIGSDTIPFPTETTGEEKGKDSASKPPSEESHTQHTSGGPPGPPPNKTTPFTSPPGQAPTYNYNFRTAPQAKGGTKHVKSTFNFIRSNIQNAALGNEGPVQFHNQHTVYKAGSEKKDVNISGGTFNQANFGQQATYENKGSTLSAGSASGTPATQVDFLDIDQCPHPYSPEEYLASVLASGISSEELCALLEKQYSIVDLAYSLSFRSKHRCEAMVKALLEIADRQ